MVRFFKDNASNSTRALQIWQILIGKAHNRQTMTYGQLAQMLGFRGAGTLAHPLGHIMHYCRDHQLPPLTVLVVNQDTGIPGEGLVGENLHMEREHVFRYDWYGLMPPTSDEFGAVYRAHGNRAPSTDTIPE